MTFRCLTRLLKVFTCAGLMLAGFSMVWAQGNPPSIHYYGIKTIPTSHLAAVGQEVTFEPFGNKTFDWVWGDGTRTYQTAADGVYSPPCKHTYTKAGSYNVMVTSYPNGTSLPPSIGTVTINVIVNRLPSFPSGQVLTAKTLIGNKLISGVFPYATDPDESVGDSLRYEVTGLPPGLTFDASTRTMSGAPNQLGSFQVTEKAIDLFGGSVSQTATWTVVAPTLPEINSFFSDVSTVVPGQAVALAWSVANPLASLMLTSDAGDTIDVNRRTSYAITPTKTTTYTLTASNLTGTPPGVQLTVKMDQAPYFISGTTFPSLTGLVAGERVMTSPLPLASDDDGDALTYSVTGLPPGLDFSPLTRVISGRPSLAPSTIANTGVLSYTATDAYGLKVSRSIGWTVTCANVLPVINTFTASPASIPQGGSATLAWTTSNTVAVLTLDPSYGLVTGTSSITVNPSTTTTYTLTAYNYLGSTYNLPLGTPVTKTVTVTVTPPDGGTSTNGVAMVSPPTSGNPGVQLAFQATSRTAASGYFWDFGDGTTGTPVDANPWGWQPAAMTHSFPKAGTYTVTARAVYPGGGSTPSLVTIGTAAVKVVVTDLPPAVVVPSALRPSSTVTAWVSVPIPGYTYAWTIAGGTFTGASTGTSVGFTAGASGTVTLTCTSTNTLGVKTTATLALPIKSAPIQPVITAPTSILAGDLGYASVPSQAGCTYTWAITGGTIQTGAGTSTIGFSAGTGSSLTLSCYALDGAGPSPTATKNVPITRVSVMSLPTLPSTLDQATTSRFQELLSYEGSETGLITAVEVTRQLQGSVSALATGKDKDTHSRYYYDYDPLGQLVKGDGRFYVVASATLSPLYQDLTTPSGTPSWRDLTVYAYDAHGNRTSHTPRSDGTALARTYALGSNAYGRPSNQLATVKDTSGTPFAFTYTEDGAAKTITRNGTDTQTLTYGDPRFMRLPTSINRVSTAAADGRTVTTTMQYDMSGTRIFKEDLVKQTTGGTTAEPASIISDRKTYYLANGTEVLMEVESRGSKGKLAADRYTAYIFGAGSRMARISWDADGRVPVDGEQNLTLTNPDFTTNASGWSSGGTGTVLNAYADASQGPVLSVLNGGTGGYAQQSLGNQFKLNERVRVQARVRGDAAGSLARLSILMGSTTLATSVDTGTSQWQTLTVETPALTSAQAGQPLILRLSSVGATASAYFDAIQACRIPAPMTQAGSKPNLWPDPGFESVLAKPDASPDVPVVGANLWPGNTTATFTIPANGVTYEGYSIPVTPGEILSGDAYITTTAMTAGIARVGLRFDSDSATSLAWGTYTGDGSLPTHRGSRQRVSIRGQAPIGATKARLYIQATEATPGATVAYDSIRFQRVQESVWGGAKSLTQTVPASGWSTTGYYMPCQPGDTFYGEARVKTTGMTAGNGHIGISFYPATGTTALIGGTLWGDGTPTGSTGAEARVAIKGTAPANAARALLYVESGASNQGAVSTFTGIDFKKAPVKATPGVSIVDSPAREGRHLLKITGGAYTRTITGLDPAKKYRFSVWRNSGTGWTRDQNPNLAPAANGTLSIQLTTLGEYDQAELVEDDATVPESWIPENRLGRVDWFITDHLGSTKLLIDQAGMHRFTGDDDPYGINLRSFGDKETKRYTGQILDEEQGVYYYGARYYLSDIGRFMSGDPKCEYASLYNYVGNAPIRNIDPTGRETWPVAGPMRLGGATGFVGAYGPSRLNAQGGAKWHFGVDISAPVGTSVQSTAFGLVVSAGNTGGDAGKMVVIAHVKFASDGSVEKCYFSRYCHLDTIGVKAGQSIEEGQTLGTVGTTGNAEQNAPHLHFAVTNTIGGVGETFNPGDIFNLQDKYVNYLIGRPIPETEYVYASGIAVRTNYSTESLATLPSYNPIDISNLDLTPGVVSQ